MKGWGIYKIIGPDTNGWSTQPLDKPVLCLETGESIELRATLYNCSWETARAVHTLLLEKENK